MLERVIKYISPKWAYRRMQYRRFINVVDKDIDNARNDSRFRSRTVGTEVHPNRALRNDLPNLRALVNDMRINNYMVGNLPKKIANHVVGPGIIPYVSFENINVSSNKRKQYERLFKQEWKRFYDDPENVDSARDMNGYEMQRKHIEQLISLGEIFPRVVEGNKGYSFSIENVEAYRVGDNNNVLAETRKDGIVYDNRGAAVGYMIKGAGETAKDYYRVDKYDKFGEIQVFHLKMADRFFQSRGLSQFCSVLDNIDEFNDYREAIIVAARMAACFGLIFKGTDRVLPDGFPDSETDNDGILNFDMKPGFIYNYNGDISQITPQFPPANLDLLIHFIHHVVSVALDVPMNILFADFQKSNYSNARAAIIEAQNTFVRLQNYYISHHLRPLAWRFIRELVISGKIIIPRNQSFFDIGLNFSCPDMLYIDQEKQQNAIESGLKNNTETLQRACLKLGLGDAEDVIDTNLKMRRFTLDQAKKYNLAWDNGSDNWVDEGEMAAVNSGNEENNSNTEDADNDTGQSG